MPVTPFERQKGRKGRQKEPKMEPWGLFLQYLSKSEIFQKPMFYVSKTMHFEYRRGAKSNQEAPKQSKTYAQNGDIKNIKTRQKRVKVIITISDFPSGLDIGGSEAH